MQTSYDESGELCSTRARSRLTLETAPDHFVNYAKEFLENFLQDCEKAFERLLQEKRDFLDGIAKDKLADWWLNLINDMCDR